jgi:hypothetical protein
MIHWVMIFRKVLLGGARRMVIGTRCQYMTCPGWTSGFWNTVARRSRTVPSDLKLLQKMIHQ